MKKLTYVTLKKELCYLKNSALQVVPKNTRILVDLDTSIGTYDDVAFDLFRDEYDLDN